jgi:ubiquinone/menaquinone biosynthesis C-methylase UbiE
MDYYEKFALYYDDLMDDIDYENWFLYIEDIFSKFNLKPKNLLEMACGTGNLTYYLCNKGYKVTCFDRSSDMLSIAYNKLSSFRNVNILNQDMVNFRINKKFDAIVSICDSINYIVNDKELLRTFKNVYEHLENDGIFIFDINSYYKLSTVVGNNIFVEDREDIYYIWQNYFDEDNKFAHFYLTFFIKENDKFVRFDEEHLERAYQIEEIKSLLKCSGFDDIFCFEAFSFNKPEMESDRINFVAKKSFKG